MSHGFVRAIAGSLLRGRFSFAGGHLPPAGQRVPESFAGVGVAAAADPAVDDWIIATLRTAGIRNLRIDFTYGDAQGPTGRLLEKLLTGDFRVVLHLLQPAEAARQMPGTAAEDAWRDFIRASLDAYGQRVVMVELCSTVNRKRWAGYTLDGFFAAWAIGWQEVRARGLTLAGPSITDFEPPWTVGLLAALKKRGQLPDIHTDNLFAERSTEPERYDHKVFGPRLAGLARVNLIKKARLLQRLGADYGLPRLFSPAAFWTLPRIERMLADSEEKQADYLSRYLLLCAASGALEGAWWGPLICHREGLVDDGVAQYPALERITHYAAVSGRLADFRVRPALAALKAFNALIPGSIYEGRLNAGQGLEVHAFRTATQRIHAVWTINGRAAALVDLYDEPVLASAQVLQRDGEVAAEPPTLVSESPLYLCWPLTEPVVLRPGAALIDGLAIHRHVGDGRRHYFFREDGMQGVVLAADGAAARLLWQALQPGRLAGPQRESTLRHARNAIWTVADPRDASRQLVVKQPVMLPWHKRLLDRFKPSKGLRSWSGSSELLRRHLGVAMPVAWLEQIGDASLKQNFYVCEHAGADFAVREMLAAYAAGAREFRGIAEDEAYRQLTRFLLDLHGRGIFFRDLAGGNILVRQREGQPLDFVLIDTGRLHAFNRPLTLDRRVADLVRICNKLHWQGRERFLDLYFSGLGKRLGWFDRLSFVIYDVKVALKRRIGRKAIRNLLRGKRG